jgi:hypothetical protein
MSSIDASAFKAAVQAANPTLSRFKKSHMDGLVKALGITTARF